MTTDRDAIRRFFDRYDVSPVGATPVQPNIPPDPGEGDEKETVDLAVEVPEEEWDGVLVAETPARDGEFPTRFIDGSQAGQPVLCVRSPQGWPIPLVLSEVGAVALKSVGRRFERDFVMVERVLSFVADPFPWEEVEALADALMNKPSGPVSSLFGTPRGAASVYSKNGVTTGKGSSRARLKLKRW